MRGRIIVFGFTLLALQVSCDWRQQAHDIHVGELPLAQYGSNVSERQLTGAMVWLGIGNTVRINGQIRSVDSIAGELRRLGQTNVTLWADANAPVSSIEKVLQAIARSGTCSEVDLAVKSSKGKVRSLPYAFPLLDGNRKYPWYQIVGHAFNDPMLEMVDGIYSNEQVAGQTMVLVTVDGRDIQIGNRRLDRVECRRELLSLYALHPGLVVLVYVYEDTRYQQLIDVLAICAVANSRKYVVTSSIPTTMIRGTHGQERSVHHNSPNE